MSVAPCTQAHRLSGPEHSTLVSSKMSREISGSAAQKGGDINSPIAGQIEKPATNDLFDHQLVAGPSAGGRARSHILSRERRTRRGAADGKNAIAVETNRSASKRPLESRVIERISNDGIYGAEREQIHRAAAWHSDCPRIAPTAILHRDVRWRPRDRDHATRSKRTVSPGARSAGVSGVASNITVCVLPMMCHPPGVSSG